jgi:hypothetical protein
MISRVFSDMLVVISYDDNIVKKGAVASVIDVRAENLHETPELEFAFSTIAIGFFSIRKRTVLCILFDNLVTGGG